MYFPNLLRTKGFTPFETLLPWTYLIAIASKCQTLNNLRAVEKLQRTFDNQWVSNTYGYFELLSKLYCRTWTTKKHTNMCLHINIKTFYFNVVAFFWYFHASFFLYKKIQKFYYKNKSELPPWSKYDTYNILCRLKWNGGMSDWWW